MTVDSNTIQLAYENVLATGRKWRIDEVLQRPSYDDVVLLLERMIEQVSKSPTPISVASGGLLIQKVDDHVDCYVFIGEAK